MGRFGVVYRLGIFGVLTNETVLAWFHITKEKIFISPIAFAIRGIGIAISYIFFKKDERKLIISILTVVGLHFIPFGVVASPLSALVIANALLGLKQTQYETKTILLMDSIIRILFGIILFFM